MTIFPEGSRRGRKDNARNAFVLPLGVRKETVAFSKTAMCGGDSRIRLRWAVPSQ
jgi:hypothetical protein